MRIKSLILPLILLVGAYCGLWYFLAHAAENVVTERADDLADYGIAFSHAGSSVSGFPFGIDIDFSEAEVSLRQGPAVLEWKAENLRASARIWGLRQIELRSETPEISLAFTEDESPTVTIPATATIVADIGDEAKFVSATLEGLNISGEEGAGMTADKLTFEAELFAHQQSLNSDNELIEPRLADLRLEIAGLRHRDRPSAPPTTIEIAVSPRGPFAPRFTPYSLGAWRDAGSTVDVETLNIKWPHLILEGTGSITLDEELRPLGALSLKTRDSGALTGWLVDYGLLTERHGKDVREALELLRAMMGANSPDMLVPVTLQGGMVSIGPLPLAELHPVIGK